MQNADLFMELAGIAGVFVGFGALIAVRSGGPTQPREVAPMRGVVTSGVLVIVGALLPVTLGFFDLVAHQIWALSTALWLAVGLASYAVILRTPEYRAMAAGEVEAARTPSRRRWLVVLQDVLGGVLFMLAVLLIAIVILLGVAPDLEAGLYFALMVIELLGAAWMLLALVFAQRLPESA